MEKRLQELEKMGKNLCTERMEGEINTTRNGKNEEIEHDHEKKLPSKSHERSQEPVLSDNTTESNNQHLSKTQKQSDLLTSNKGNVRQTKTAITSDSTDESGISPALHIQSSNRFNSNTLSSKMCQRSQCVGCYGHPDGIVLTSLTLLPFLSVDKNTCRYHRKMLDCMRNRKPMIIENTGSNSITRSLSKHGDEQQSQANIHLLTDPYKYSKTTVSNEIPPTPPVPQPRNTEQGCNLPNTENIQFSKFNPIYSQPISQQCYSTYMEPAQCQPTSQHYHSTHPQYYTAPTQYYYECCPTSSSLQSGYPILPQSTSQQLYPMQPQYQSTSVQYHPLQPQYYTTSLQYHPQHHPTSQYNPITSQHLPNDLQHHAVSSQCNSTYPQHCSSLLSTYNDYEGDEHPTLSHADPLPVTKETERTTTTTCHNETLIDQTTSCDVDPLSITTCYNETVGQSSSQVIPVIIDEQKTATIACGNERSTVDNASIVPACSNNISKPSHSSHTNIHNKQQNYTPLQDSTNRQKSLSVYDYATPVSDRKRWQPFTQPVNDGIKKLKVSIHNMFTLVCILNISIELCTVAMHKDLLSYCISRMYMEVCYTPQYGFYVLVRALLRGL